MKMIVSDFDETFSINIDKNIKSAREFINNNNLFVIATGSSYQSYIDKLDGRNFRISYLIVNHGATVYKDNKILYSDYLNNDLSNNIYKDIINSDYYSYFFCNEKVRMSDKVLNNTTKINIVYKSSIQAEQMQHKLLQKYGKYINCYLLYETLLEITNIKASKINAINNIMKIEGIPSSEVYTIGDGYNDIEMIKKFNGCAMKNSVLELKQVASKQYSNVFELIKEVM